MENLHRSRQKGGGSAVAAGCHRGALKDPEVQCFKGRSLFVSAVCPSLAVGLDSRSMVSTCSHLVPEESVEQLDLSTAEGRWQWYRAKSSRAPDLGRFPVSLPGVAGSPSVLVENSQSVSQVCSCAADGGEHW